MAYVVRFLAPFLFLLATWKLCVVAKGEKKKKKSCPAEIPFNRTAVAAFNPFSQKYNQSSSPSCNNRHKNELPFHKGKYGKKKVWKIIKRKKGKHSAGDAGSLECSCYAGSFSAFLFWDSFGPQTQPSSSNWDNSFLFFSLHIIAWKCQLAFKRKVPALNN